MASEHRAARADQSEWRTSRYDEMVFRMEEITRALRQQFERRISEVGLTRTQWRLLAYLLREDGQTQSALAQRLDLERATVGETIDRLEKRGLVERRPCPTDRRVWNVCLRRQAHEIAPFLRREADKLHALTWTDLSEQEIALLDALLRRIAENLSRGEDKFAKE